MPPILGPILLEVVGLVMMIWLVMRRGSKTAVPIPMIVLLGLLLVAFGIVFAMTFTPTESPSWLIVPIRIAAGIFFVAMLVMIKLCWPLRAKPRAVGRQGDSSRLSAVTAKRSPKLPPPFL